MSMSIILLIGFLGLFVVYPSNGDLGSFSEMLRSNIPEPPKNIIQTCQEQSHATSADIEIIKSRKVPQTKTGKCMLECIFTNAKLMKDGAVNKLGMIAAFTPATKGDLSKIGQLKEFAEECEKEIGNNEIKDCRGVDKFLECVSKNGKKFGFNIDRSSLS